ncbi:MAG: cache domain-containing protein, partial [Burkholderiaceae bacterium]|nr:cache domain-containing protein [Burkholderiaceae bacterium]
MTAPTPPDPDSRPRQRQGRTTLKVPSRLWRRWWRAQSTASQDRVATFAPLIAVLVFLLAIVLAIGYLRIEEMDREQETITRDVAYAQQRLRLHIISAQDQLTSLAGALTTKRIGTKAFQERTPGLFATSQDLDTVSWLDANNRVIATQSAHTAALTRTRFVGDVIDNARSAGGLDAVKELQQTIFTRPIVNSTTYSGMDDGANFMILVPIFGAGKVKGTLVGEFSIEGLLRYGLPAEVVTKYAVALVDSQGNTLAGNVPPARPMLGDWLP